MPFLQEGGSAESDYVAPALPSAHLIVDLDKVLFLKRGFEEERDRVRDWLSTNWGKLNSVKQPGSDPCSEESVQALGENGDAAARAAWGYADQLQKVAESLGEIAQAYGLTEDEGARRLERKPR